ncbi:hypothetical protein ACPYPG_19640 [Streptomyces sp. FR-108]|uniref:hypothetical protein n=1 Tax=Streptomyces sp. FR-108 TaxID=3416665 RepID=UPI003CEED73B
MKTTVGPYRNPPASVGGDIEVVFDPRDLSNVVTPGEMMSGRVSLPASIISGLVLAFSLLMLFFGARP